MKEAIQNRFEHLHAQMDERYDALKATVSHKIEGVQRKQENILELAKRWAQDRHRVGDVRELRNLVNRRFKDLKSKFRPRPME